jgi:hypothetical protein
VNRILLCRDGGYDRAAIMTEAAYQFRVMGHRGWTFGRCLSFAWKKAQAQRERCLMDAVAYFVALPRPAASAALTAGVIYFPHVLWEPLPPPRIPALFG